MASSISGSSQNANQVSTQIVEGVRPSLEQIYRWFEDKSFITINEESIFFGIATKKSIQGKIKKIGPYVSEKEADALFWIKGHPFGIYVRNISCFRVEEISPIKTEDDIYLVAGEEKFMLNRKVLQQKIPFFRGMINFLEAKHDEIDLSASLSSLQLKLIKMFLEKKLKIDSSFKQSDALHLFLAANFLGMEDLKDSLIDQFHFMKLIDRIIKGNLIYSLSLECRKISYERGALAKPSLGMDGIVKILELASSLGSKVTELSIYNVNDEDLPILISYLKGNNQIEQLDISWNNIRMIYDSLTDKSASLIETLIRELPHLKQLKISGHNISDLSLKSIAAAVENNSSLEYLDLRLNKFSSQAWDDFIKKLALTHTFKNADLKMGVIKFSINPS